jgi:hypothetical protein
VSLRLDRCLTLGCAGVASGRVVQAVDGLTVGAGDEVTVHVHGRLDGGVAICSFTYAADSPFWSSRLANVWRRSWNRTRRSSAFSSSL